MDPVQSDCDTFYYHDDGETVAEVNGQRYLRSVVMGRDGDIGESEPGPCSREYNLARKYVSITGVAGVIDASDSRFTCVVDVMVDGVKKWSSREVKLGATRSLHLKVEHALRLKIEMTFVGPGPGDCVLGEATVST